MKIDELSNSSSEIDNSNKRRFKNLTGNEKKVNINIKQSFVDLISSGSEDLNNENPINQLIKDKDKDKVKEKERVSTNRTRLSKKQIKSVGKEISSSSIMPLYNKNIIKTLREEKNISRRKKKLLTVTVNRNKIRTSLLSNQDNVLQFSQKRSGNINSLEENMRKTVLRRTHLKKAVDISTKRLSGHVGELPEKRKNTSSLKLGMNKRRSSLLEMNRRVLNNKKKETIKNDSSAVNFTGSELEALFKTADINSEVGKKKVFLKTVDVIIAILVVTNIVLSLIENELFYLRTNDFLEEYFLVRDDKTLTRDVYKDCEKRKISVNENFLRYINSGVVAFIVILYVIHYRSLLSIRRKEGTLSEREGLCSTGLWKYLILEIIINIILNPPHLNFFFTGEEQGYIYAFSLGGLINIITFFKAYSLLRVYSYYSKYMSQTAKSICINQNSNPGIHFAFKSELKNRPFTMLFVLFFSSMCFFGYALRTFEYFSVPAGFQFGSFSGQGNDQDFLKDLLNSIWLSIVTMTTVGYGDFVPTEIYGKIIMILAYLIGTLCVSMTVVALAIVTEFSENEKRAFSLIKKINADTNVFLKAGEVISVVSLLRYIQSKKNIKLSERFIYLMKIKQAVNIFKDDFKLATSMPLPIDQTLQLIVKEIETNYTSLTSNVNQLNQINDLMDDINNAQKDCTDKLKKIQECQLNLGKYLINLNNEKLINRIKSVRK